MKLKRITEPGLELRIITTILLRDTVLKQRTWKRISQNKFSSEYTPIERYAKFPLKTITVRLVKTGEDYILVNHSNMGCSGLYSSKFSSREYIQLKRLGRLIFEKH